MKLSEAVKRTTKVADNMPDKKQGVYQRFNDLVEEIGELANTIQVEEGWKTKKRAKSDLVNSVCDVLYSVFLIAGYYKIDLEKEYPSVLKEINKRRKEGEFDHT